MLGTSIRPGQSRRNQKPQSLACLMFHHRMLFVVKTKKTTNWSELYWAMLLIIVYCLTIRGYIQTRFWRFYLKNDRGLPKQRYPETYMWEVQDLENDRGLPNLPKAYRLYNKYSPRLIYKLCGFSTLLYLVL